MTAWTWLSNTLDLSMKPKNGTQWVSLIMYTEIFLRGLKDVIVE